jgi:hypothetical protein
MLAKRSQRHEQLEKLVINRSRFSVHAEQVRALLECKDCARAVPSMQAKSSALHLKSFVMQNCQCVLCQRPT